MIMIKTSKKTLSELKEKLHNMRIEVREIEELIEDCNEEDVDYSSNDYDDVRSRSKSRRSRYDY